MLEWYRLGFSLEDLMRRGRRTGARVVGCGRCRSNSLSYREALRRHAGFDPLRRGRSSVLQRAAQSLGLRRDSARARRIATNCSTSSWARRSGPALGADALTFLHRYPASQAALARLDPDDPRVALRFELYHRGIELANGYHELASGAEQRSDSRPTWQLRAARGLPTASLDRAPAGGARRRTARLRRRRARIRPRA